MLFGTEDPYVFQKAKIALVSAARRRCALNPAQLIQVVQLLHWRHPEIRMGVELLIKLGRSGFVSSDTEEIGPSIGCWTEIAFSITIVAVARFEWPAPTHGAIISIRHLKSKQDAKKTRCALIRWTLNVAGLLITNCDAVARGHGPTSAESLSAEVS
jgi:hypothetical protein